MGQWTIKQASHQNIGSICFNSYASFPDFVVIGLLFCFDPLQCRLIVSTMCLQACQRVNLMLYPLAVITLLVPSISTAEVEVGLLALYTAAVVFAQIHYGVCLVSADKCFAMEQTK